VAGGHGKMAAKYGVCQWRKLSAISVAAYQQYRWRNGIMNHGGSVKAKSSEAQ